MSISSLTAVSPIDGRYHRYTECIAPFFSEYALIHYRIKVEIEYLIQLCEIIDNLRNYATDEIRSELRKIYLEFDVKGAERVKEIEGVTNHDVKAVEYYIKEQMQSSKYDQLREYVHFALTSQDINNTAQPLALKDAMDRVWMPLAQELLETLSTKAKEWEQIPMLAKTHGQPASPTKLGKEFNVFVYRLQVQLQQLATVPHSVKFGGATGNMNAHHIAYPDIDWRAFAHRFASETLHLQLEEYTTQISNYDNLAALLDNIKRVCTILIDLSKDIWLYVSMNYFKQKIKEGEVGSSTMPHKVNPIDFENAEGNLGLAVAICEHLSHKLPISRLQRDLTDSTVMRNLGLPLGYSIIALRSLLKGIDKLIVNKDAIYADLDDALPVVGEALQTILRREGYPKPYEALKQLTRSNQKLTVADVETFIDSLDISEEIKKEMKQITPRNYTGVY